MPNPKPTAKITDRDRSILVFLWLWKVSTTAGIWRKFFSEKSEIHTTYRRLWQLKRAKFIAFASIGDGNRVWTLAKAGFELVKEKLPYLKENGFKSEHVRHDYLVSAFHLGGYLVQRPENVSFITEQQLRRYSTESLPSWVPETNTHRPDGFTHIKSGNSSKTVAIEVELNRKSIDDYRALSRYYDSCGVSVVLWLVPSRSTGTWIQKAMGTSPKPSDLHQYILLDDFLQLGWDAKIRIGTSTRKKVRNEFSTVTPHTGHTQASHTLHPCEGQYLLDTRIKLRNTATYQKNLKTRFCY